MFCFSFLEKKMSLTKENVSYLDLPDLLLNIWDYGGSCPNDEIINQYLNWYIELAKKQWKDGYHNFNDTIEKIYI